MSVYLVVSPNSLPFDRLSLYGPGILTMARWCYRSSTPACYVTSTIRCYSTVELTRRPHSRSKPVNMLGLISGDQPIIDGVKDELQAVGNAKLIKYVRQVMFGSVLTYA